MKLLRFLGLVPLLVAAALAVGWQVRPAAAICVPTPGHPCPTPTPATTPSPTPQPPPAIGLSTATGSPGDTVSVTGSYFQPNSRIDLDWNGDPKQLLGANTTDQNGNLPATSVKLPNSPAGDYKVCTVQVPTACADLALLGAQPSPSPSPSPSPNPSPSPSPSASPSPAGQLGGPSYPSTSDTGFVGQLLTPPLLFLPLLLLAGVVALGVWWWRSRAVGPALQTARVVHSSGGGAEPDVQGWHRPAAQQPPPPVEPAEQPADEPPDHPEPGE